MKLIKNVLVSDFAEYVYRAFPIAKLSDHCVVQSDPAETGGQLQSPIWLNDVYGASGSGSRGLAEEIESEWLAWFDKLHLSNRSHRKCRSFPAVTDVDNHGRNLSRLKLKWKYRNRAMEEIDYSVLFRWLVGLNLDEEVLGPDGVHQEPRPAVGRRGGPAVSGRSGGTGAGERLDLG